MAKSQVTITLGRSGQRVVKEPWGASGASRPNTSVASGSKRSLAESVGSSADHSLHYNSKRMREDVGASNYGYKSKIHGPKDLRLKLMQKRMSRRVELEIEERKKKDLCERVSRTIRSMESPEQSLHRSTPSSRRAAEPPRSDAMGNTYASWTSSGVSTRSPDRVLKSASGLSTPRSTVDELPWEPSTRPMVASRTGGALMSNPFDYSRERAPLTTAATTGPMDSSKLIRELPPATGGMSRSLYPEPQPVSVSSLLHSLGLGKYSINFQAEEIDMVALKQMGDRDLKELGIPMGPRKKILLALQVRTKRPTTQARINSVQ